MYMCVHNHKCRTTLAGPGGLYLNTVPSAGKQPVNDEDIITVPHRASSLFTLGIKGQELGLGVEDSSNEKRLEMRSF